VVSSCFKLKLVPTFVGKKLHPCADALEGIKL
jgi:hypothetical protein